MICIFKILKKKKNLMMKSSKRILSNVSSRNTSPDPNFKKRTKTNLVTQSNTLMNYFASNKKITNEPEKLDIKQGSILTYFKSELSKTDPNEAESKSKTDAFNLLMQKNQIPKNEPPCTSTQEISEDTSITASNKPTRKCPFYKRIEGFPI